MTRFSTQLKSLGGDPVWFSTVELMYIQRLESWLVDHNYAYTYDGLYFTVDDVTWTVLALWDPEPCLCLTLE